MKIIQLIQKPQLRGAEIFACQLSNHLIGKGVEIIVVSIFKGDSDLPFKGKLIRLNRPLSKRFTDIKSWKEFSNIVIEFQADIVQANAADTLKFAVSSKIIYKWDSHIVFRNANKMGDFIDSNIKWYLNKFYLSRVSYVISVSKECEKDLIQTFNYPIKKIRTVEIGVEKYRLGKVPEDLTQIFQKGSVITHIGGFVPEKNHDVIIEIFSELKQSNPSLQLLLLGKGRLESIIKIKVKRMGLSNSVHFLGYRNDVLNILRHSKVFILPSLIEGLPGVILEAMYAETPVVAYNVGGIGEIVKEDTGWLVPKNDKEKFTDDLIKIFNDPEVVNPKVRNAKEMISEKFQNDIISKRFSDCYKDVITGNFQSCKDSKMRILQLVTRRQYRGAELFAADLSTELIHLGHEVVFAGIYESKDDILRVNGADNRDLINEKKSSFSIEVTRKLVKLLKEIKPDLVQCNGSDTLKYMYSASYFVKDVPVVYRNISIISEWISSSSKKLIYKNMFRKISYVTSVGNEAMADFIQTYNYPAARTEIIRRGIPIKKVDKISYYKNFRSELNLPYSTKIAVHIGNFSPEKNHEFLIDVFNGLKEMHPEIKLICIGSGVLFEEVSNKIKQKGLEKSVFLLGFRKDIPEILAASDCLVLCSKIEGVPGVILEAGTQKTPSIATNVGGVKEVLINGKTGFLIDNFDTNEFRNKLIQLMGDEDLRERLGENAYEMISKGYDPKLNARKFEKLYQRLINEH